MTRSTEARYRAPVPTIVSRPVLWEVADIVEQILRFACIENLHPRPEDYDAATCDHQAACGLSDTTMREVRERAQGIALMRLYGARWRLSGPLTRRPSGAKGRSRMVPRARRPRLEAGPRADWDIVVDMRSQPH